MGWEYKFNWSGGRILDIEELKIEVERLVKVMEVLRGSDGCPWDRKQDYYSLQPYILEEAYEVVEALQKKDLDLLEEELGDLLLQVVFQAQIGRENGDFDLNDIFSTISDKMIRRHPHVFGEQKVDSISEVMTTWREIKNQEKFPEESNKKSILADISRDQPALNQAYEIQNKAAKVGFDWNNLKDVIAKIEEELAEVKEAISYKDKDNIEAELGDLLFAVVNLTRFLEVNPELALLNTILKFKQRFKYIERKVRNKGFVFTDLSLEELDVYWEESKKLELREEQ